MEDYMTKPHRVWESKDLVYAQALQKTLAKLKGEFNAYEISEAFYGFKWLDEVASEIETFLKNPTPQTFDEGMTTAKVEPTKDNKATSPVKPTSRNKKTSKSKTTLNKSK